MKYLVQRVALFWVRLALLVGTSVALLSMEFQSGTYFSPVGSPLVVFHRLEWAVLPLLAVGWFLQWGAARELRRDRGAS